MNNEKLQNETDFRRFLLGEMTEEERIEFEGNFILDEELFENLRVAEDELIESYIRGTLELSEKTKFEANFLTTQKRRERVEFTRQMLEKLNENKATVAEVKKTASVAEKSSFLESILAFFKQPQFALGAAFAVLLLAFGGWFVWKNSNQTDIVQNTPTPTPQVSNTTTPQVVENKNTQPVNSNPESPNKNVDLSNKPESNVIKPTPNPTPTPKKADTNSPIVTTLALFAGGVRSDGKTNELNLSKETTGANLQLNLESQDYKVYRAEIVDQNGNVIYRSGRLSANNSKITTFVSAKNLKRGDYIVKVYGKNAKNEDESVADYQFRVNQK